MKKALEFLSAGVVRVAITLITISVIAFFVLASFVPIGGHCYGISLLAFVTPLCGESDIPQSAYLFVVGGAIAGIILLGAASSVKGLAIVFTLSIAAVSAIVYLAVPLNRDFPGADYIRSATHSVTDLSDQTLPAVTPMVSRVYGSAAPPTQTPSTAITKVVRETAAPTRAQLVTSVGTAPVQNSNTRFPVHSNTTPTYTPKPTLTNRPILTPTRRPTFTPRPTLTPTRRPTPTPQWRPPTVQELVELKQLMLELTNAERAKHGAPPVELGGNPSPQIHAEHGLKNCYSSHWDQWGLKPLYRYALSGGDQYTAENGSGIDYCPQTSDNYRINYPRYWADEVRETVVSWMGSPGHRRNLIDSRHTVMHVGIAIGKYGNSNMVQVFSGDYVTWSTLPNIREGTLTAAGQINEAFWDARGDYTLTTISYHPPTQRLTPGQLAGTYCLEGDTQVGSLSRPLQSGWYYTDPETGRKYTDYTTYARNNRQCVNPYELAADRPVPASWNAASAQYRAAIELSNAAPDEESIAYQIVSERLDISSDGSQFSIQANLSPILSHYGPGIYTVTIWATTPDRKPNPVAQYPIWWHSEPTPGHPY